MNRWAQIGEMESWIWDLGFGISDWSDGFGGDTFGIGDGRWAMGEVHRLNRLAQIAFGMGDGRWAMGDRSGGGA